MANKSTHLSYYEIISYQMMLRHFSHISPHFRQSGNAVIMAASRSITTLVEDALAFSEARCFPMIW